MHCCFVAVSSAYLLRCNIQCLCIVFNVFITTEIVFPSLFPCMIGYLGPVSGLTGIHTAFNTALFQWSMPYSLHGVPVLGYQFFAIIINSLTGDLTLSYNVSLTNKNYSITKLSSFNCTHVNITVRAINSVGQGEPAHYSFRYIESKPLMKVYYSTSYSRCVHVHTNTETVATSDCCCAEERVILFAIRMFMI